MDPDKPFTAAVLGAGLIGVDLVAKIQRSSLLECRLVVARDDHARGLRMAARLGCQTSSRGLEAILDLSEPCDVVFDATNAMAHAQHWARLEPTGTTMIDLTPSMIGSIVVPTVNGAEADLRRNINLISCGGQAAIPLLHRLAQKIPADYIEVVTTAASRSVGRATRLNLDEYLETTQAAISRFTGVPAVKVMVNLSPAQPPSSFRVAISMLAPAADLETVSALVDEAADELRSFVPGYRVTVCSVANGVVFVAVEVEAIGDYVPHYAGNLDIINAVAVHIAERQAMARRGQR
jgi:acetaldehyde dehydrogenase